MSVIFILIAIVLVAIYCSKLNKRQKVVNIPLFFCLSFLMLISFLFGHLHGYLDDDFNYRVDSRLISAISYIKLYQKMNNKLPSQSGFESWQSQFSSQHNFTYFSNPPESPLHLKMWGEQGSDFIVGFFTGEGMQFYSSKNSLFYYE